MNKVNPFYGEPLGTFLNTLGEDHLESVMHVFGSTLEVANARDY